MLLVSHVLWVLMTAHKESEMSFEKKKNKNEITVWSQKAETFIIKSSQNDAEYGDQEA